MIISVFSYWPSSFNNCVMLPSSESHTVVMASISWRAVNTDESLYFERIRTKTTAQQENQRKTNNSSNGRQQCTRKILTDNFSISIGSSLIGKFLFSTTSYHGVFVVRLWDQHTQFTFLH
eukprot:m.191868 g.191868  ORF g.191868 m.191868 type:complete len:120 (+) comp25724_c0_seq10:833-1192(+)